MDSQEENKRLVMILLLYIDTLFVLARSRCRVGHDLFFAVHRGMLFLQHLTFTNLQFGGPKGYYLTVIMYSFLTEITEANINA